MPEPYELTKDDDDTPTDEVTIHNVLETLEMVKRNCDNRERQLEIERVRLFIYDAFGMNDILPTSYKVQVQKADDVISAIDPEKQNAFEPDAFEDTREDVLETVDELVDEAEKL